MVDYIFVKKLYKLELDEKQKLTKKLLDLAFINKKNIENISFCFTKNKIKPNQKDISIVIEKLLKLLFIKIERIINNKDLRKAIENTKHIWTEKQSLDLLMSVCRDMGKEHKCGL